LDTLLELLASTTTHKELIVQANASSSTQIVNPIIESTFDSFNLMMGVSCRKVGISLKTAQSQLHPISAVIGLTGNIAGTLCLNFSQVAALGAVKRMVDIDLHEITSLVCDTVGEFANVIAGSAKNRVAKLDLGLGLPTVIHGSAVQISFPRDSHPICIDFESDIGPFKIVFGFVER